MLLRKFFANMLNYIDDQIPAISNSYLRKLNHCTRHTKMKYYFSLMHLTKTKH
jgi:hypothetical protein